MSQGAELVAGVGRAEEPKVAGRDCTSHTEKQGKTTSPVKGEVDNILQAPAPTDCQPSEALAPAPEEVRGVADC